MKKLPKTPEEAIAHLISVGMYRRPLVRMVREALDVIGAEYAYRRYYRPKISIDTSSGG